jgi:ABC-type Fe3+/spermidine/putrescine transport system ATPase subunit
MHSAAHEPHLLRCLAGIERVTSGQIVIGGRMVADGRVHVPPDQRDLSMVFQDYALWPHLKARENVAFALRRRKLPRAHAQERSAAMLDRVGLGALGQRYPNELSGGEQQRVALARALVADTGLILCDEPLSNLDADLRERMRLEISALVREGGAGHGRRGQPHARAGQAVNGGAAAPATAVPQPAPALGPPTLRDA